jgi:RNase P subunit RPR2
MQQIITMASNCIQRTKRRTTAWINAVASLFHTDTERTVRRRQRRKYYEKKYNHVSKKSTVEALEKWKKTRCTELLQMNMDSGRMNQIPKK